MTPWVLAAGFGDETTQWAFYALAAVTIIYLVVVRPMVLRRRKDPLEKGPRFGLAQQREVEKLMSDLLVELSNMARQVSGQLDTRAARLQILIEDADRRIAELKSLSGRSDEAPLMRIAGEACDPLAADAAEPPSSSTLPSAAATAAGGAASASADPRYAEVYALADQGESARQIAQRTRRPQGEVELILALRPR